MDGIVALGPDGREELFEETAARLGIGRAAIIEKDFWVCWTLRRLFALQQADPGVHPSLVFKGGTSLSKVFGLIQRFSEDIDLSLDWHGLGFTGERDPATAGTNQRKRLLDKLAGACESYLASTLVPALRDDFAMVLGAEAEGEPAARVLAAASATSPPARASWSLAIDADEPQTVHFTYPPSLPAETYTAFGYVRPTVRLEFGARGEQWPASPHTVIPYAAQVFPELFRDPGAEVRVLEPERTFWEKATILHAWAHRGALPGAAERGSRHYYDLAMLARSPVRGRALSAIELLVDVATHKQRFYPAAWARYELARPGTLRLVPDEAMVSALRSDYAAMAEMIFGDVPSFDVVLASLGELEREINGSGRR